MLLVPLAGQPQSELQIQVISDKVAVLINAGQEYKQVFAEMDKLLT